MIDTLDELLECIQYRRLTERQVSNVELKRSWDQEDGKKISAFANRPTTSLYWICVGISDDGVLCGGPESWANKTEETISQHINKFLDPQIACLGISCHEQGGQWFVILRCTNPGSVVYWNKSAYKGAGTTIELMEPEEVMQLTIALPGLTDYSGQEWTGEYDQQKAGDFARAAAERRSGTSMETITALPPDVALQRIGIFGTNTQRILFGDVRYRLVKFDLNGIPVTNENHSGLYGLLQPSFLAEIQSWLKDQLGLASEPYPTKALREGLSNAVAHAAYFDSDGDVIVELFPDKLCISNLCVRDSGYFANKWFSRSHKTVNRVLMEALRLAGFVDELGRGKNLIFAESLRNGKKPPEVVLEKGGRYDRWRLYIYGSSQHKAQFRVFQRLKEMYGDEQKVLIANALVLWRGQTVSSIRQYVDGESSRTFAEVLADLHGPIFYYQKNDQIVLRRWVRVLIGEGKESKQLSAAEEEDLLDFASKIQIEYHRGYITPKQLREFAGMGDTPSEIVLSSQILKRWKEQGKVTKVKKGLYRFERTEPTVDVDALFKLLVPKTSGDNDAQQSVGGDFAPKERVPTRLNHDVVWR
jgi:hypothetical protein